MDFRAGSHNLNDMVNAVQKVAKVLFRDFGEIQQLQNSHNGVNKFALHTKNRIEEMLVKELKLFKPKYGYMTSSEKERGSDISHTFIIDALNGVDNFSRGIPHFCISVALQEQNKIIAGVVYNPVSDMMYYAEKGAGAFFREARSSRRIRVGQHTNLDDALVCFSTSTEKAENAIKTPQLSRVINHLAMKGRYFGCPAMDLAYTADNKNDAFVGYNESLFGLAAPLLIFKEAGGSLQAYDSEGNKEKDALFYADFLVASNEKMSEKLSNFLFDK
ncbi:MAG: inositol monophosphatase [Alphaproteobacteria bacterium]|jgi:myo-inositol-1(or 4)-monophosphatase|nr:inositol monophosphatase [Alphaproteobacteria bacterium]